jgi:hypothetical protein
VLSNREVVLSQLPSNAEKPQSRPSTAGGPINSYHLNKTPGSVSEVQAVIQLVQSGELSDTDTLLALEKLGKAAANAMAESTATRSVNQDLVDATKKKEKRKQQNREDGTDGSYARVMGRDELLRRREFGIDKMFEAVWKEFSHIAFAVVFSYNITAKDKGIKPRSPTKSPTKSLAKLPTKSQLPLPPFTSLIIPSLSNIPPTPNSRDPIRKSPKRVLKKVVKTIALSNARKPASKAPWKRVLKVAKKASSIQLNQAQIKAQIEPPKITRSGRTVKRKIRE